MDILLHPVVIACLAALVGLVTWGLKELYTKHNNLEKSHQALSLHVATHGATKDDMRNLFLDQKLDMQRGFDILMNKLDTDRAEFISALTKKQDK